MNDITALLESFILFTEDTVPSIIVRHVWFSSPFIILSSVVFSFIPFLDEKKTVTPKKVLLMIPCGIHIFIVIFLWLVFTTSFGEAYILSLVYLFYWIIAIPWIFFATIGAALFLIKKLIQQEE